MSLIHIFNCSNCYFLAGVAVLDMFTIHFYKMKRRHQSQTRQLHVYANVYNTYIHIIIKERRHNNATVVAVQVKNRLKSFIIREAQLLQALDSRAALV